MDYLRSASVIPQSSALKIAKPKMKFRAPDNKPFTNGLPTLRSGDPTKLRFENSKAKNEISSSRQQTIYEWITYARSGDPTKLRFENSKAKNEISSELDFIFGFAIYS